TEDWIVVVGHHPIYAYTDKSESERTDMQKKVDTILRKHNVDMYICGHIHNYQHIRRPDSKIDYVVNTSGSLTRTPKEIDGTIFCNDSPGFSVLTADKNNLRLNMLDKEGKAIYVVSRAK
ncbi:metallophosphoesterase, partial [uncultured Muribaculum sp.]|uniref:metallophosphoesterase n=1 Tax=uncultured Muribaculum sp. TaxID=1918613 RepID=UPI0027305FA1